MCSPVRRWRRSATIRSTTARSVAFGLCLGRDERSPMPARPSALQCSTHRFTTFAVTANFNAAWAWETPPSMTRKRHLLSTERHETGVLMGPSDESEAWQLQSPRSGPNGRPPENSHLGLADSDDEPCPSATDVIGSSRRSSPHAVCLCLRFPLRLRLSQLAATTTRRAAGLSSQSAHFFA
jgi:hypothetical protein